MTKLQSVVNRLVGLLREKKFLEAQQELFSFSNWIRSHYAKGKEIS